MPTQLDILDVEVPDSILLPGVHRQKLVHYTAQFFYQNGYSEDKTQRADAQKHLTQKILKKQRKLGSATVDFLDTANDYHQYFNLVLETMHSIGKLELADPEFIKAITPDLKPPERRRVNLPKNKKLLKLSSTPPETATPKRPKGQEKLYSKEETKVLSEFTDYFSSAEELLRRKVEEKEQEEENEEGKEDTQPGGGTLPPPADQLTEKPQKKSVISTMKVQKELARKAMVLRRDFKILVNKKPLMPHHEKMLSRIRSLMEGLLSKEKRSTYNEMRHAYTEFKRRDPPPSNTEKGAKRRDMLNFVLKSAGEIILEFPELLDEEVPDFDETLYADEPEKTDKPPSKKGKKEKKEKREQKEAATPPAPKASAQEQQPTADVDTENQEDAGSEKSPQQAKAVEEQDDTKTTEIEAVKAAPPSKTSSASGVTGGIQLHDLPVTIKGAKRSKRKRRDESPETGSIPLMSPPSLPHASTREEAEQIVSESEPLPRGVSVPSRELQIKVHVISQQVAEKGKQWEDDLMATRLDKYPFLHPVNPYHEYYKWRKVFEWKILKLLNVETADPFKENKSRSKKVAKQQAPEPPEETEEEQDRRIASLIQQATKGSGAFQAGPSRATTENREAESGIIIPQEVPHRDVLDMLDEEKDKQSIMELRMKVACVEARAEAEQKGRELSSMMKPASDLKTRLSFMLKARGLAAKEKKATDGTDVVSSSDSEPAQETNDSPQELIPPKKSKSSKSDKEPKEKKKKKVSTKSRSKPEQETEPKKKRHKTESKKAKKSVVLAHIQDYSEEEIM